MAGQWIEANEAVRIVAGDPKDFYASDTILARTKVGLIRTKARLAVFDGREHENIELPTSFWQEHYEVVEQKWERGDFRLSNLLESVSAFGVCFDLVGLLDTLPAAQRPLIARSMSVAASLEWITAKAARAFAYNELSAQPVIAGAHLIEECRLGFVAARAVLMQRADGQRTDDWTVEQREWDVPDWFWRGFTIAGSSAQDWEQGGFRGFGPGPAGHCWMILTGVYFNRASLEAMLPLRPTKTEAKIAAPTSSGGRPPAEYWDDLWCAIWGDIYRGDFQPGRQSDVEKRMLAWASDRDHELSPSSVKPRARKLFAAYNREDKNS